MKVTVNLNKRDLFYKLKGTSFKFMFACLEYADAQGVMDITPSKKEAILAKLSLKAPMYRKAMADCVQAGVFTKVCRGAYAINHDIFTLK